MIAANGASITFSVEIAYTTLRCLFPYSITPGVPFNAVITLNPTPTADLTATVSGKFSTTTTGGLTVSATSFTLNSTGSAEVTITAPYPGWFALDFNRDDISGVSAVGFPTQSPTTASFYFGVQNASGVVPTYSLMAQQSTLLVFRSDVTSAMVYPWTSANGQPPPTQPGLVTAPFSSDDPAFIASDYTERSTGYFLQNFFSRTPSVTVTTTDRINNVQRVFTYAAYGALVFASEAPTSVATGTTVSIVVLAVDLSGATLSSPAAKVSISYTPDPQRSAITLPCVSLVSGQAQFSVTLTRPGVVQFSAAYCDVDFGSR